MNQLLQKFNDYKSIVNYKIRYEFEDGNNIEFVPKQTDFPHLIGLHKLIDIPIIRQFNDKNNQIAASKKELEEVQQKLKDYEKQIKDTEDEINRLEEEIQKNNEEIEKKKKESKKLMEYYQIRRNEQYLQLNLDSYYHSQFF